MKLGWGLLSMVLVCVFALVGFYQVQQQQDITNSVRCSLVFLMEDSVETMYEDLQDIVSGFDASSPLIRSLEIRQSAFVGRFEENLPVECTRRVH
jgi:hypothetical protein